MNDVKLKKVISDWHAGKLDHFTANWLLIQLASALPSKMIWEALDNQLRQELRKEVLRAPNKETGWDNFRFVPNHGRESAELKSSYRKGIESLRDYLSRSD